MKTSSMYSEFCSHHPVQCAPPGVCILRYLLRSASSLCFCNPVASKGMVNQVFSCAGACWVHHSGPPSSLTPLPEAQRLPVEPRVEPPAAVSFPFPVFFFFFLMLRLAGTARPPSKTNWWVKSEYTQNILYSQVTSLCCPSRELWSDRYEAWRLMWGQNGGPCCTKWAYRKDMVYSVFAHIFER